MNQTRQRDHLADPYDPGDWVAMAERGYAGRTFAQGGISHLVFQRGSGPALLLLHELPGLTTRCVDLADRLVDAGFEVHLPLLFGHPMAGEGLLSTVTVSVRLCINEEFGRLKAGQSAPVADWLRALAADISAGRQGQRIGALGLCVTGGFVVPLILEPAVAAAVASQPAAPLGWRPNADLTMPEEALQAAGACARRDGKRLLLQRFAADRFCPAERVQRIADAFGPQAEVHTLERPGEGWHWLGGAGPHAILTREYDRAEGRPDDPAVQAMARVIDFFRRELA